MPQTLKYLSLGNRFNQPVNNLPESLLYLYLYLSNGFNQPVNNLPANLTYLYMNFGINCYDWNLDNLPSNLKYLDIQDVERYNENNINLNKKYNKNLIENLPNSIEELIVNADVSLDNLPNSIKILCLQYNSTQSFDLLPNSIELLSLNSQKNFNFNNLPKSINNLTLYLCDDYNLDDIKSLYNLKYFYSYHLNAWKHDFYESVDTLPDSIEHLVVYVLKINKIPPNLKIIESSKYNKFIQDYLNQKPDLIIIV